MTEYPALLPEDLEPMTAEQIAEVRAQRTEGLDPENIEPEPCKVPGAAEQGRCGYAGPDGEDACGEKCIYVPEQGGGNRD